QSPRTYAPKPGYAVRFWRRRRLSPPEVDTLGLIRRKATRFFGVPLLAAPAEARLADSREPSALEPPRKAQAFDWVITSPPYYGMRTYVPDQWLRNWFLGGTSSVDYGGQGQLVHSSPEEFAADLRQVWRNAVASCSATARLVIRFGGIADRRVDPIGILKRSLEDSGWRITTLQGAGTAHRGKRQADAFLRQRSKPLLEYDVWARPAKASSAAA